LEVTLRAQGNVISRQQAYDCGMTRSALAHRLRPDGPWQRVLPSIYLAQTGTPNAAQREMAALLHAGPGSVLTGQAALYGLGLLRQTLDEVADGIRSIAEAEFRELIERARLPMPMFNARLFTPDGAFIAAPDAWWADAGVAAEVDSKEWHLRPADWEQTLRRHAEMSSHGILVLHFTPGQIRTDPTTVIAAIADTLRAGRARPPLLISGRAAT
jgi:hypothetical protein